MCGGKSAEHDVSLLSTAAVVRHLDRNLFKVTVLGIARDGTSMPADLLREKLELADEESVPGEDWITYLFKLDPATSIVFPVLHGPQGEDGTVQGMLEILGLPYVGAGVGASAVGMNKIFCKSILRSEGLPVLPWRSVSRETWNQDSSEVVREIEEELAFPLFVKPANMGSSVGVNKSHNREELLQHLEIAFRYDDYVLAERGIDAREIEVSVLGGFEPRVSIPGEILPVDEFYSYEAKYLKEGSRLLVPAPLDEAQVNAVGKLGIKAFQVLQLEGMARLDFLIDRHSGEIWVNEPNTIPGFTQISMYPKLWEASGLPYPKLLEELIGIGLSRHRRRARLSVER